MKAIASRKSFDPIHGHSRYRPLQQVASVAVCATALLLMNGANAADADSGWYGTVNVGRSAIDANTDDAFARQGVTASSSVDKHDTAYSLGLGYQFNRNFALEGGYNDFGRFDVGSTITAPVADTAHGRYKVDGWNLTGVGIIPLDNGFSVYGKAGLLFADTKLDMSSSSGAVPVPGGSKSSTNGTYGLGASYAFTNNVIGKLEWNRYQNLGESSSTSKVDLNTYTMGVSYRF